MFADRYGSVIIGGGPAGLAPLVSASRTGSLDELLSKRIVIVERGPEIGAGRLGNYAIWSDSTAATFLTAVTDHLDPRLSIIKEHPLYREFFDRGAEPVPLTHAAELMRLIGQVLREAIVAAGGLVLVGHEAVSARRTAEGDWVTCVRNVETGSVAYLTSRHMVLATGGHQPQARLLQEAVGGQPLLPRYSEKVIQSDCVLQPTGFAEVAARLGARSEPKVAIVGGSTSAMATADLFLRARPDLFQRPGSITLLHRRPLRVFYRSREEAWADNYRDFDDDDICPLSGFVYRLAGFRLHSRQLLMRLLEIGTCEKETRVVLHRLRAGEEAACQRILDEADVIVAALGYRPLGLPLYDEVGDEIPLLADQARLPLVDRNCRVLRGDGREVENVFGIGLAAGFVPHGPLGGERSFVGQANGLWLWQTAVGALVVDHLRKDEPDLETSRWPAIAPFAQDNLPGARGEVVLTA